MSSNCCLHWLHGSRHTASWELTLYHRTVVAAAGSVAAGSLAPWELTSYLRSRLHGSRLPGSLKAMSTPAAFDTTLLVPAASGGSQPSGPRSPWSPDRQVPRSIAPPIVELAEMEGGRTATIGAQLRGQIDMLTSATPMSQHVCGLEQRGSRDDVRLVTAPLVTGKAIDEHASDGACRDVSSSRVTK